MRRISLSRGKRPKWMIEIAIERMNILFERAEMEFKGTRKEVTVMLY